MKVKRICHKCEKKIECIRHTCEEIVQIFHKCDNAYDSFTSVKDSHEFFTSVIRSHDMCDKFKKRVFLMRSYSRPQISLSTTMCCEKKNVEETSGCSSGD